MPAVLRRPFLVKKIVVETPDTRTFRLEPEDGQPFNFTAGQWVSLGIFTEDRAGFKENRPYSIASSAADTTGISITFRIVGSFTNKLNQMHEGQRLGVMGPFGQFQFKPQEIRHAVFIAGGIGVTPMMGMARFAADRKLPTPITFFYSNKTLEQTTFHKELSDLSKANPAMKVVFTLTQAERVPAGWEGETGRFNQGMLAKYVPDYAECTFFICGPVKMTQEVAALLTSQLKVPSSQIHVEGWG